jgi:hypothetical protein
VRPAEIRSTEFIPLAIQKSSGELVDADANEFRAPAASLGEHHGRQKAVVTGRDAGYAPSNREANHSARRGAHLMHSPKAIFPVVGLLAACQAMLFTNADCMEPRSQQMHGKCPALDGTVLP